MTTLVVGAHGIIGGAVAEHLHRSGVQVATLARRGPLALGDGSSESDHFQLDLLDRAATTAALRERADIEHVVYAAYLERRTMLETVEPNLTMLRNVLDAVTASHSTLRHVVLIGGGKSYAEHLGGYKTPAKESDPRFLGPIFYNDQEDHLAAHATEHAYTWTVLRPDGVIGTSIGSPMNILSGVATYAAICRHLGLPLRFPGTAAAWTALHQATDSRVLAAAVDWALSAPAAAGEIFNVTNGDHFRWMHLWEDIADFFGVPTAPAQPLNLVEQMADKGPVWDQIVSSADLAPVSLDEVAAWPFVDGWLSMGDDMVQSTIKIRRAGFTGCIDTHESVLDTLHRMRTLRLIP
jgi:nucleoside-diphosphate-sugar epimerase